MGGGDHDAAVEILRPANVGHGRGGGDVQQVGIGTGGHQAAHQAVLEHVAGAAGSLADDDVGWTVGAAAALQLGVVPAQKPTDPECMVSGQSHSGIPPEAVRSKIYAHNLCTFFTITPPVFQMDFSGTTPRTQEVG